MWIVFVLLCSLVPIVQQSMTYTHLDKKRILIFIYFPRVIFPVGGQLLKYLQQNLIHGIFYSFLHFPSCILVLLWWHLSWGVLVWSEDVLQSCTPTTSKQQEAKFTPDLSHLLSEILFPENFSAVSSISDASNWVLPFFFNSRPC